MILYIISSEVQFLVGPLSSTGCQYTTSALLSFLQWQLLPLKNLVATICDSFVLFSRSCSTSSSNYLQPVSADCVFIYFLFNRVGITDLVSVLGDSYC